jgi:hypothetical protein
MFQNLKVRVALIVGLALLSGFALFMNKPAAGRHRHPGAGPEGRIYLALEIDESSASRSPPSSARRDRPRAQGGAHPRGPDGRRPSRWCRSPATTASSSSSPGMRNTESAKEVIQRRPSWSSRSSVPRGWPRRSLASSVPSWRPTRRSAPRRAAPPAGVFQQPEADTTGVTAHPFESKLASAGSQGQFLVAMETPRPSRATWPSPACSRRSRAAPSCSGASPRPRSGRASARSGWWTGSR